YFFFFQAEDGIRGRNVTGVQTCALPISIMYAPTWEGENESNNYTSVDLFGPQIVEAALRAPGTRLIYKPHPRVESSKDPAMSEANTRILELIAEANDSIGDESLQHQVLMQGNILAMF